MTVDRASLVSGYVLQARPWRNTSMLVEAFTSGAGRLGLVAHGVRQRRGGSGALLEPFQPLLLSWSGRGELHTLRGVEVEVRRPVPAGRGLLAAYYCSELVLRLLGRDDPNAAAFAAYDRAIAALADGGETEPALRRFELDLLEALGFGPPLEREAASGEPVDPEAQYDFVAEHGPVRAAGPVGEGVIRVPGAHLRALVAGALDDPGVLRSARRVLRASLSPHLGARPLRTREVYRAMYGEGR